MQNLKLLKRAIFGKGLRREGHHNFFQSSIGVMIYLAWVLSATWTGCDTTDKRGDDRSVVLKIVWMGPELETYKLWKEAFEGEHAGVTLDQQFVSYDQGPTFYNTMIQGDNLPDLGFLFMGMIPEYVERGVLEPLDAYITSAARDEWIDVALSAGEYRGKIYGVPLVGANRTLYVRRDWMREVGENTLPTTWEEVRALAQALNTPPERYGFCIGAGRQKHLMQDQISMMWGFGAYFFDRDGNLAINSPAAIAYVEFLTGMYRMDEVMPPGILNLNANDCYAGMAAGKVGMLFSGPWQDKMCRDAGIECEPLMIPDGVDKKMLLIVDVFGMFSTSKHKDLGYEFIRFIQRPENRMLIDVEVGGVPMTENLANHAYYESAPIQHYQTQKELLELTPKHPEWTKIQDAWGEAIQMVLAGTATSEEALNTVYQRLMRELINRTLPTP